MQVARASLTDRGAGASVRRLPAECDGGSLSSKPRRASSSTDAVGTSSLGDGLDDLDASFDDDIEAALAQALAASEAAVEQAARKRRGKPIPTPAFMDPDDSEDDADVSTSTLLAFEIDDEAEDDSGDFAIPGLDEPAAVSYDDMDRELRDALTGSEAEPSDNDLQSEMEALLAESFGLDNALSDEDPDLAFPELSDAEAEADAAILEADDDDDDLFLAGDDGVQDVVAESTLELERLRTQVTELSRLLSSRDLELRASEDRADTLQAQVITAGRAAANATREYEKFRKRAERDAEDLKKFAGEKIIKEFLGVYDNLERALAHSGSDRDSALGMGVEMTLGQFMAALRRCGADRVESSPGTPFDPTYHEAVGQGFSDDVESGAILSEMQGGFVLNGRLVRAAMVMVSRGSSPEAAEAAPEADDPVAGAEDDAVVDAAAADEAAAEGAGDEAVEAEPATTARGKAPKKGAKKKSTRKRSTKSKKTAAPEPAPTESDDAEAATNAEAGDADADDETAEAT
jgi:molecular chaperone GrpE